MIPLRFIDSDGHTIAGEGLAGERLLDVARRCGLPLEGTCNGDLACATCHVVVAAEDFGRLPPAREEEEDMLDLAPDARRTSRLSCQIVLADALAGLTVRVPQP